MIPPERGSILLAVIKVFKGLSAENLRIIAEVCLWHRHEEDEDIVRYHDSTNSVFFITQGGIRIKYHALSGTCVICLQVRCLVSFPQSTVMLDLQQQ